MQYNRGGVAEAAPSVQVGRLVTSGRERMFALEEGVSERGDAAGQGCRGGRGLDAEGFAIETKGF